MPSTAAAVGGFFYDVASAVDQPSFGWTGGGRNEPGKNYSCRVIPMYAGFIPGGSRLIKLPKTSVSPLKGSLMWLSVKGGFSSGFWGP